MNQILFPTDFTEKSINAFDYALDYALKTNSKLIVFHSYNPNATHIHDETQLVYDKVDIQNFRNKKDSFPLFEKILKQKNVHEEVSIKYIVKEGVNFIECLTQYIDKKDDKIDLVIVGAHSRKNNLLDLFFEPRTLKLLDSMRKPVIAVPSNATFDGSLDNFVFLVDYRDYEIEALEEVIAQSEIFRSSLHVIHFDLSHTEDIVPMMDKFKESVKNRNLANVIFKTIDSINIKKSLKEYCTDNNIDIVCLINKRRNSYQRFFTYSLTEDLLANFDIPVMALYEE